MSRLTARALAIAAILAAGCSSSPVGPGEGRGGATQDASTPDASAPDDAAQAFTLQSYAFVDGGTLPVSYTCDGAGNSPPLSWSGAPAGTTQFALLMTTLAPDGLKWNWVLYGIPGDTSALAEAESGIGTAGLTSDGPNLAYSPPCSQGPGAKVYAFTAYALSGAPTLPVDAHDVTGAVLAAAIAPLTLSQRQLSVSYTRP